MHTRNITAIRFIQLTIAWIALLFCNSLYAQHLTKRALFLGNSYTYVNNLPQMLASAALSTGDSLIFDSNTPGGYTLEQHSTNAISLAKIAAGNWDYVVLQEQSQLPSFPNSDVNGYVFPYARILDSLINQHNTCAETVFYMTWGRKNGDADICPLWPPVCTYNGMDSLISLRYRMMAERNKGILSPVGAVWKYLRLHHPAIELYAADESHPAVAGSYAAACSFYSTLFRKNPAAISYDAGLPAADAAAIRNAAKAVVFDSLLKWQIGKYDPSANFSYTDLGGRKILFTNLSANATDYYWNFGDSSTSTESQPTHTYSSSGTFTITLISGNCFNKDTLSQVLHFSIPVDSSVNNVAYLPPYPNPVQGQFQLKVPAGLAGSFYRLFDCAGRMLIKEKIISPQTAVDISRLPAGMYLLKFENNAAPVYKLIKE